MEPPLIAALTELAAMAGMAVAVAAVGAPEEASTAEASVDVGVAVAVAVVVPVGEEVAEDAAAVAIVDEPRRS